MFLTGDIHSGWACELPLDAGDLHRPSADRRPGSSSSCTLGHVQQPQGHHRHPAAHDQHRGRGGDQGQQPAHQVPQLRRPRLLGARHDAAAGADGLVHHRRPGRPRRRDHLDRRRGPPTSGTEQGASPSTGRSAADERAPSSTPADAAARCVTAGAAGPCCSRRRRRCPAAAAPAAASAPTCWWSTAADRRRSRRPDAEAGRAARQRAATTRRPRRCP